LFLLLNDQTGFEIPWELLYIPSAPGEPRVPLGSAVAIARWQLVLDSDGNTITAPATSCSGSVIAYLSPALSTFDQELALFGPFSPFHEKIHELRDALRENRIGVSLVYLACHGTHAELTTEIALTGFDHDDKLILSTLDDERELRMFGTTDAVVFLNACHSGRPVDDRYISDSYLRGFVELFLRKGARGVLGATGEVDTDFAAEVAARMLDWAQRDGGAPSLARLLRDLRSEIVASLPPAPDDGKAYQRLIWSSMYVYFGNPLSRLKVVGP
jgi:hypothetical protein